MKRVSITAKTRESGKGAVRRLRAEGQIPAVLYGRAVKPVAVSVDRREFLAAVKTEAGMNVLFNLSIPGVDSGLARIRDYQADPFRREFTHVDFQAISLKEKLEVEVPIKLVGAPPGVEEGGVVEQARRSLHLRALPDKIPSEIKIDISALNIGDGIHADEVILPEGVEFPHRSNFTIVAIVPPSKIEEVAPPPEVVPEEAVPAEGVEGAPPPAAEKGAAEGEGGEEKSKR
jgi:large subunit ribosomal protein L25